MKIGANLAQLAICAGTALSALTAAIPASAQVDEVIVTATKRAESIQDIPVSVSAYSGERLELTGVRDIRDLQALSPSFSVVTNNRLSTATPAIRGIGTLGNNPAIESSVGVFIDGVYRARPGAAMGELGSFERIELLKGPQSTLFGRNTAAGAISLITKSPNLDEFEGWGEISYGNYDFYRTSGFLSGPIIQGRLGANAELVYANRDGWAENQNGQDDSQDRDRLLARVQLAGDISDKVSFRVIGDFTDYEDNCCASSLATLDGSNGALVQRW